MKGLFQNIIYIEMNKADIKGHYRTCGFKALCLNTLCLKAI